MDNRKTHAKRLSRGQVTLLTSVLYYRELASQRLVAFWSWLLQTVYNLNPYALWKSDDFRKKCLFWYCAIRARFDAVEREKLLEWACSRVKKVPKPTNFSTSWKDGVALCALMESLSPGSCPRYDSLDPDKCHSNVHQALEMAREHLRIKPSISVDEMLSCVPEAERKLVCLLSQLKMSEGLRKSCRSLPLARIGLPIIQTPDDRERSFGVDWECEVRGMGLTQAVKGRQATFNIFLKTFSELSIVIEIKGPNNTIVSERITNRSPKRKALFKEGTPVLEASSLLGMRSRSHSTCSLDGDRDTTFTSIPFEYEVQQGKISVVYVPLITGKHRLSIIWQGQHVKKSPYIVKVDDSVDLVYEPRTRDSLDVDMNPFHGQNYSDSSGPRKMLKVTKRRVLRHILSIDGKEIVVEDADVDHLGMAIQAFKEVEEREREEKLETFDRPKMTRQHSLDEPRKRDSVDEPRRRDSVGTLARQKLTPVQEDITLKDVRSPSPNKIIDCGPMFSNIRPRAMSYTESEISSLDGIETGCSGPAGGFKWDEIPDANSNYNVFSSLNPMIIPSVQITVDPNDLEDRRNSGSSESRIPTLSLLDITNLSDETDSITPEYNHDPDNYDNNDGYFETNETTPMNSFTEMGESDEWLVVSMDTNTQTQSVEISDQRVKTPIPPAKEPEGTPVNDEVPVPTATVEETEVQEYHTLEEYHSPIHQSEKRSDDAIEVPGTETEPDENSTALESVTNRKQFFENLLTQTKNRTGSPQISPVKVSRNSPARQRLMAASYSVDEPHAWLSKTKAARENLKNPKSQSLCSLSDDTVEISPTFLKAREFWEKGKPVAVESSTPEVASINRSPSLEEEELANSVRKKLDFWQTLTGSSKPSSPDHRDSVGDKSVERQSDDGEREVEVVERENPLKRLESPGSEGTRDSGVFFSSVQTSDPQVTKPALDRSLSYPGAQLYTRHQLPVESKTLPLTEMPYVYRHNPLFSLDTDSFLEGLSQSGDALDYANGGGTISDDRGGYIDDEIPDYASLIMDRYISFTGLLDNDRMLSRNELIGMGIESLVGKCYGGPLDSPCKDVDQALLPKAGKCHAFGAGVYYGQVGVRNQFQVCTEGAGKGCLTVSVQGPGEHDVAEVVVSYMGEDSYEIMYEVLEPGYYIISVKWSEWNIPESPFICKVTY